MNSGKRFSVYRDNVSQKNVKKYNVRKEVVLMSQSMREQTKITVLIAPTHLHSLLRLQLVQERKGMLHMSILSLSAFFQRYKNESIRETDVLLQYHTLLKTFPAHIYQSILSSLDFCKQCFQFIEDMKVYHIPLSALPEEDDAQKEMKRILTLLYPIRTPQDIQNEVLVSLQQQDLSHVMILEHVWSTQDRIRIQALQSCGARRLPLKKSKPEIFYYRAMNKRKEVEVLAQKIIANGWKANDLHILVCDPSYPPFIVQVFERYHIPCTVLRQTDADLSAKRVSLFLQYVLRPHTDTLLELLEINALHVPYRKEFAEYVTLFAKTLADSFDHVKRHAVPSQLIDEDEIARLLVLEDRANRCKEGIVSLLNDLMHTREPEQILTEIDKLLLASASLHDAASVQAIAQIHELFQAYLPYFHTKDDIPFLVELCDEIRVNKQGSTLHGAAISDLHHPLIPGKINVILGSTQKNFPAFQPQKGLFHETYVQSIASYPSLNERCHPYIEQLKTAIFAYEQVVIAYPMGTLEGKTNESSLEMEQWVGHCAHMEEPLQSYQALPLHTKISPESAQALFVKNGAIHGSISAFERYVKCPFSYFLRYGLHVREPMDYQFSQSRIGTLSHYLLETLVERYGKEYANGSRMEVETLLEKELETLCHLYPRLNDQKVLLKQRMMDNFMQNLQDLREMEEHSHLVPFACEQEFWWDIPIMEQLHLHLHGFIDRIDADETSMRIIDYKSSMKTLSQDDVFSGLQLQLMIYALYAKKTWNKNILGAFYWSMKKENIAAAAGKMSRRPVAYLRYDAHDWETQRRSFQRLTGWVLHPGVERIDDNGSHIVGVRTNKDGIVSARTRYRIDVIETLFTDMLRQIATHIVQGDIACRPTKDACTFCPYHDICRFHGYSRIVKPLVDATDVIDKGGN